MNKTVLIPVAALVIGGAIVLGTKSVSAQTTLPTQTLVQKIAQKFGLNQADVQSVFDDNRKEMQTKMQANMQAKTEERLTKDVTDGKITDAQKQLIIAKLKELTDNRQSTLDSWKTMTEDQRKAVMQTQKQALDDWAKQNNIDVKYLMPKMGFGMRTRKMMK